MNCQVGSSIEHAENYTLYLKLRIHILLNQIDSTHQLTYSFQSIELALNRNEDGVRRRAQSGRRADVALDAYRALVCAVWESLDAGIAPEVPELRVVGAPGS